MENEFLSIDEAIKQTKEAQEARYLAGLPEFLRQTSKAIKTAVESGKSEVLARGGGLLIEKEMADLKQKLPGYKIWIVDTYTIGISWFRK
jgi:hypothetical protein